MDDRALRHAAVAANRALVQREGNLHTTMNRTLELLDDAVAKSRTRAAQGTRWRTKASRNGEDGSRFGAVSAESDAAMRTT
jgi:hypothetical protein